jgi:hypothetical protein
MLRAVGDIDLLRIRADDALDERVFAVVEDDGGSTDSQLNVGATLVAPTAPTDLADMRSWDVYFW